MMETTGVGTDAPIGFLFYWPGVTSGSPAAQLFKAGAGAGTKQARTEQDAFSARVKAFTPNPTWAFDVYQDLRIVVFGSKCSMALNGIQIATGDFGPGPAQSNGTNDYGHTESQFVGLIANNCNANFKNIKLDYLALP